jgi:hypothetical protein
VKRISPGETIDWWLTLPGNTGVCGVLVVECLLFHQRRVAGAMPGAAIGMARNPMVYRGISLLGLSSKTQ